MEMVQVEFEYEYTAKDGALVSIKPNERYMLVSRTNDYWWHVRKDQETKPFYIPAKYVRELSVETQGPLDLTSSGTQSCTSLQATTDREPPNMSNKGQRSGAVTKVRASTDHSARATTHRMSTFVVSQDIDDIKQYECMKTMVGLQTSNNETTDFPPRDLKRRSLAPGFSFTSASDAPGLGDMLQHRSLKLLVPPEPTSGLPQLQSGPPSLIKDPVEQQNSDGRMMKTLPGDPSGQSHLSHDSDIYETMSDTQHSELTDLVGTELSGSLGSTETPAEQQQSLDQTSGLIDVTAPPPTAQALISPYTQSRALRSSTSGLLVPLPLRKHSSRSAQSKLFAALAPQWWNKLPHDTRTAESLTTFRRHLKPYLIKEYPGIG